MSDNGNNNGNNNENNMNENINHSIIKRGGLLNLGNTCAVNALIQCLYNIDILRDLIINTDKDLDITTISAELQDIFQKFKEGHSLSPKGFIGKLFEKFNYILTPGDQFDIGELWMLVGDKITDELNDDGIHTISKNSSNFIELQAQKLNNNKLNKWQESIQGITTCITNCNNCVESINNVDLFIALTLDIETHATLQISDMIQSYFKVDHLSEWSCDTCKQKGCQKQYQIYKLPSVLIILIKRFKLEGNTFQKLANPLNIPLNLHINYGQGENKYVLKSVGNHFGVYNGGHYTACVIDKINNENIADSQWKHIDDLNMQDIKPVAFTENNSAAYLLFYEKLL